MKRKGFTLVELLAVIVILAIIALIATPMILGVIEDARKGSAKTSALGFVDAVEKSSLVYAVNNGASFKDGKYEVDGKNLKQNDNVIYTVDYKGDTATGTITISNGQVTSAELIFGSIIDKEIIVTDNKVTIGDEVVKEPEDEPIDTPETGEPEEGPTKELPMNGETYKAIVYLDPTDLSKTCNASEAVSTTGTKTGCMKWYAFTETEDDYYLILDHNTTFTVAYNSDGTNTEMKEVKNELDKLVLESDWKITPRLITADEVAEITRAKDLLDWTSDKQYRKEPVKGTSISYYYLDGADGTDTTWHTQIAKSQGASKYSWMYDNSYECIMYGCNVVGNVNNINHFGYWTSTHLNGEPKNVWIVMNYGNLSYRDVTDSGSIGIRPVITIKKSIISE